MCKGTRPSIDENLKLRHDKAGLPSIIANAGPNTNNLQV